MTMALTKVSAEQQRLINARILQDLNDDNTKEAQAGATEVVRTSFQESAFTSKILPPQEAPLDRLLPGLTNDMPQVLDEIEIDASPGSTWVPFQTTPPADYMWGSKFLTPMARIVTPMQQKDLAELYTYKGDLRKAFTEKSLKYGEWQIDFKFMAEIEKIVTKTTDSNQPGAEHPVTGKVQWRQFSGGLIRENFVEAMKMLPRNSSIEASSEKFGCQNYVVLCNNITIMDFLKWERLEVGGDLSERMAVSGLIEDKMPTFGLKVIITTKQSLVPDGRMYFFAEPSWLGRFYYLHDWTMLLKKEAFMISSYAYWLGGISIANIAAVARADFID